MKKVINKANLDELIRMIHGYYHDEGDLSTKQQDCRRHINFASDCFGSNWLETVDLVSSIVSGRGFKPDATNEDFYKVLEVLGWVVK